MPRWQTDDRSPETARTAIPASQIRSGTTPISVAFVLEESHRSELRDAPMMIRLLSHSHCPAALSWRRQPHTPFRLLNIMAQGSPSKNRSKGFHLKLPSLAQVANCTPPGQQRPAASSLGVLPSSGLLAHSGFNRVDMPVCCVREREAGTSPKQWLCSTSLATPGALPSLVCSV